MNSKGINNRLKTPHYNEKEKTGAAFSRCPCVGRSLKKLVRPAILLLLYEKSLYGYKIGKELSVTEMFTDHKPNITGIYRCLKTMTDEGLLESSWDSKDGCSPRRLYTITPQGRECLLIWLETLTTYNNSIDSLIKKIRGKLNS